MTMTLNGSGTGTVGVPNIGTAVNTTSGTSVLFSGLPAGLNRITIILNGVSTNGTNSPRVQIGSGSVTTSGYIGAVAYFGQAGGYNNYGGGGFDGPNGLANTSNTFYGHFVLTRLTGNTWVCSSVVSTSSGVGYFLFNSAGSVALSGTLDRVNFTSIGSTDSFDAGTVNIIYE